MADEENGSAGLPDMGESLDQATFEQILEMDDDEDDREFSKSIVFGFFEQTEKTLGELDTNLEQKNLNRLSELGHFLKGSSATLGLTIMKNSCEKIQHLGHGKDESGEQDKPEDYCLKSIASEVAKLKKEFKYVKVHLAPFFGGSSD